MTQNKEMDLQDECSEQNNKRKYKTTQNKEMDLQDDGIIDGSTECSECGALQGKHCPECSQYPGVGQEEKDKNNDTTKNNQGNFLKDVPKFLAGYFRTPTFYILVGIGLAHFSSNLYMLTEYLFWFALQIIGFAMIAAGVIKLNNRQKIIES